MGKEAAQQRQGKPQNKNQPNQQKQQPKPQPKPQEKQEPAQSNRKLREESQKNAYEDLIRRKEEEIRKYEHEKKALNAPINKTYSLVRNHQNDLDKFADLSPQWIERTSFMPYLPQDNARDSEDVIQHHNFDISNLLKKDYKHFWSQILYDESLQIFLDSYLRFCSRPYDAFPTNPTETRLDQQNIGTQTNTQTPLQQALFRRVFHTLIRISQYEETTSCHMEKDFFAQHIIREKKIWDVPKILDFCVLFGPRSKEKVSEVVDRLFTIQPELVSELTNAVPGMEKALESAVSRITSNEVPASYEEVVDIGTYLMDTSQTIRALLLSLPRLSHSFLSYPSFFRRIAHIYDNVLPVIENTILNPVSGMDQTFIEGVEVVKRNLLEIVHTTWQHTFYDYFSAKAQGRNVACSVCNSRLVAGVADELMMYMSQFPDMSSQLRKDKEEAGKGKGKGKGKQDITQLHQHGTFVKDMDKFFKLQTSLNKLKGTHTSIDNKQLQDIIQKIREISGDNLQEDVSTTTPSPAPSSSSSSSSSSSIISTSSVPQPKTQSQQPKQEPQTSTPPAASSSEEKNAQHLSLISQVKDLFPDLGDGFVDLCLQFYNYQSENLINALLEGSLPPQLESLDRKMPLSTPKPTTPATTSNKSSTPITLPETDKNYALTERKNVFDGDEFDVMSRRADTSRVYHGKKTIDLTDRDETAKVKTYVTQYLRRDELAQLENFDNDRSYDDDYDDSYDEFNSFEVGTEGESLNKKGEREKEEEEDSDEEGKEGNAASGNSQQQQQQQQQQRGGDSNRGRGRGGKGAGSEEKTSWLNFRFWFDLREILQAQNPPQKRES